MTEQDNTAIDKLLKKFAITVKERRLYDPSVELEIEIEKAKQTLLALSANEKRELLNKLQQSFDQHTTPESKNLLTRSYIDHTMQFERATLRGDN